MIALGNGIDEATILERIEDAVRLLAEADGGQVSVAGDEMHLHELLSNAPAKWRLILGWDGGEAVDPEADAGHWDNCRFYAIVQMAPGLASKAGKDLHRDRAGDTPIIRRVAEVKALFRALYFQSPESENIDCRGFRFVSSAWVQLLNDVGQPMTRAHRCEFAIVARSPRYTPEELS